MKLVFQENPKFGDEQDVIQQIRAIDEHIDKLQAEIKRFEVRAIWKSKVLIDLFFLFSAGLYRRNRSITSTGFSRLRFDIVSSCSLWFRSID